MNWPGIKLTFFQIIYLNSYKLNLKGADVWSRNPDIYVPYSLNSNFKDRCDEMISWFLKFDLDLSFLYFGEPDLTGNLL